MMLRVFLHVFVFNMVVLLGGGCDDNELDSGDGPDAATSLTDATAKDCPEGLEQCQFSHGGWNVWCEAGTVFIDDLYAVGYCQPDDLEEVVCYVGGSGEADLAHNCQGGCTAEGEVQHFCEFEEFEPWSFDFSSLCADALDGGSPVDAQAGDAG